MGGPDGTLYWRLSAFYLLYFASVGALGPFWGLYLQDRGLNPVQIGQLMAILMVTRVFAPSIWAWLADRRGVRMPFVRYGSLAAAVCFLGVFGASSVAALALVMVGFSFFWNGTLPQFEATTLDHLGDDAHRYSLVRLWGSLGFILSLLLLGELFGVYGRSSLPWIVLVMFVAIWISSLLVPEARSGPTPVTKMPLSKVLRRPEVLTLLATCFLMQASHGPYYVFFSIYLDGAGYSQRAIGILWAASVLAEIAVFLVAHRLLLRLGTRRLLVASMALTALRWWLVAVYVDSLPVMLLTQLLHAASFGTYHAAAMHLIFRYFRGHQGQGQALYAGVSFGAGGALGSVVAGYTWTMLGAEQTFVLAALVAAAGLLFSLRLQRG